LFGEAGFDSQALPPAFARQIRAGFGLASQRAAFQAKAVTP
jgi:hypothetical protein